MLMVGWFLLADYSDKRAVQNTGRAREWQARIRGKSENGVDSPESGADFPRPFVAGWSSLVARQAHNLKVVGSNPTPAPNLKPPETLPGASDLVTSAIFERVFILLAPGVTAGDFQAPET